MKVLKAVSGIFVALALFYSANHFVAYRVSEPLLLMTVLLGFAISFFLVAYPKRVAAGLLVIVLAGTLILGVDVALTQMDREVSLAIAEDASGDFFTRVVDTSFSRLGLAKWIKQDVVQRWGIDFGDWLVYDRISAQLLWGEDPTELQVKWPVKWALHLQNEKLFALLSSIVIGLVTQFLLSRWMGFIGLFIPLVAYMVLWYIYIDLPSWIYGLYMFGLAFYGVLRKAVQLKGSSVDKQGVRRLELRYYRLMKLSFSSLVACAGVVLITSLVVGLLPLKAINQVVDFVLPNLWGARTNYDTTDYRLYSLGNTGYQSEGSTLGGPVERLDDQTPLFWLEMGKAPQYSVYLKGQIKHVYDGNRWLKSEQIYKNHFEFYRDIPKNEALIAEASAQTALDALSGKVIFDKLKTISIFAPTGFYESSLDPNKVYASMENQAFYKGGIFVSFIEAYSFKATQRDFTPPIAEDLTVSKTVPEDLVLRLKAFSNFGKTPQERVALMTRFLKDNYTYNLKVKSKRVHPDFVTNFLLESREGYCTYFASAMAVMARINGIPARYVEGFRVDPSQFGPEAGKVKAKVTEADAHAWVEVYFEGEGWRVVEATAPYQATALQPEVASAEALARAQVEISGEALDADGNPLDPNAQNSNQGDGSDKGVTLDGLLYEDGRGFDGEGRDPEEALEAAARAREAAVKAEQLAKEKRTRAMRVVFAFGILLAGLMLLFWWWPVLTRFKRVDHKKLVGLIYDYEALFGKTQQRLLSQGALICSAKDLTGYEAVMPPVSIRMHWDKLLFAPAHSISEADRQEGLRTVMRAYESLLQHHLQAKGWIKHWIFRLTQRV